MKSVEYHSNMDMTDHEDMYLKANYWLTGEPNTKGNLYIDLGCVLEVAYCYFQSRISLLRLYIYKSASGDWISRKKHPQLHLG